MHAFMRFLRRLWYLLNRQQLERQLRDEMEAHRAEMSDARHFGNTLQIREQSRDVWGWHWLDAIASDLRIAARSLKRNAAYSVTAIFSLASGIWLVAVTTAVVGAFLQRALPYEHADRLYHVMYAPPGPWEPPGMSRLNWSEASDVVDAAITASSIPAWLPANGDRPPQIIRALRVNAGFVAGLGIRPAVGRALDSSMFAPDAEPAVMLGHSFWRQSFRGDSAVVGTLFRNLGENGELLGTFRIAGVLPPHIYFGRDSRDTIDFITQLATPFQSYMVRLREGITPEVARMRITQAARNVGTSIPADWAGITLESVHERYVKEMRPLLRAVTVATVLFFLIICVNLAVLVLLRALRRQKEMAVRSALGAGQWRLLRLPVAEGLLIAFAAIIPALLGAALVLRTAAPAILTQLGRPSPRGSDAIAVNPTVIAVCVLAALFVVLLLSLVPAAGTVAGRLQRQLRSSDRASSSGPGMRRLRGTLLVAEIGASLALLIGSGLMVQSAINVIDLPRGFETSGIVRSRLGFPPTAFPTPDSRVSFFTRFRDETQAQTGVRPVFSSWPPFAEQPKRSVQADAGTSVDAGIVSISDGYVEAMHMQLKSGRDFVAGDRVGAEPVVMVSEALGRALWGAGSLVGRRLRHLDMSARDTAHSEWLTVVGVVGDVRSSFSDNEQRDFYTSYMQNPPNRFATITMKSDKSLDWWSATMKSVLKSVDSRVVARQSTPQDWGDKETQEARFIMRLLVTLSSFALLLAVVGILAVTAYSVQQRERETAIRMALGATQSAIRRLFLRGSVRVVLAGSVAGTLIAVAGTRVLASRMYGVSSFDIPTYVSACALMGIVSFVAVWLPSLGAASVHNLRKLRGDD